MARGFRVEFCPVPSSFVLSNLVLSFAIFYAVCRLKACCYRQQAHHLPRKKKKGTIYIYKRTVKRNGTLRSPLSFARLLVIALLFLQPSEIDSIAIARRHADAVLPLGSQQQGERAINNDNKEASCPAVSSTPSRFHALCISLSLSSIVD